MKKLVLAAFLLMFIFQVCQTGDGSTGSSGTDTPAVVDETATESGSSAMIQRGEYLVTVAGCNDCHTPKIMTEKARTRQSDDLFFPIRRYSGTYT